MKKNFFFILMFFLITDTFCQTFVSTVPENKNVILEEFTGLMCTYCPDGHLIANQIKSSNQNDFFTINIHEGYYAVWPNRADYTTNIGNAITNLFPAHGHPSGVVNRGSTVLGRGQWAGAVNSTIGQSSFVNVAAKSTIDLLSRELTVEVEAYYTGNGSGQNNINIALLQNNVEGYQYNASANPSQVLSNGNYNHMHMLRHMVTGLSGDAITSNSQGSFFSKTYTYTIPQNFKAIPFELLDAEVLVFVTQGLMPAVTGSKSAMEFTTSQPGVSALYLDSVTSSVSDYCMTSYKPKITVRNNNNTSTASYDVSYTYNGGSPVSITENNLGPDSSRISIFPAVSISEGEHIFEFNIDNNNSVIDVTSSNDYNPSKFYTVSNNIVDFEINEGFQSYQINSTSINKGFLENSEGLSNFKITNRGNGSTRSLLFGIYDWPKDVSSSLVFDNIDLSNTTSPSLKFSYAYTQRVGGTFGSQDRLIVEASYSCGKTWVTLFDKSGNELRTSSPRNSFFYPLASDWDDVWKGLEAWSNEDDVIIRFRCISDNGNNLFLDDIQVVDAVGIVESSNALRVFPNPAENSATIELQGIEGKNIKFELYNILGEIVFKGNYKPTSNFDYYNIDLSLINNGIYNLVLRDGELLSTKKLQIIK
tara:strand:- start:1708 stop:3648 length:1941 start_codon:yes stop_codon:yes gene_type:complete